MFAFHCLSMMCQYFCAECQHFCAEGTISQCKTGKKKSLKIKKTQKSA